MKYKIKKLMQTDVSKIYIMGVIIFCLILLGSYFSYAMFTVNKEKNRAISIVTGTLDYELKVDNNETNIITVPSKGNVTCVVNLNNINSRDARLNFYYIGDLPSGVDAGYIVEEGTDIPPIEKGEVFSKAGSNGDKKVYKIKVKNTSGSSININLGVQIGLDYNDLSLPSNGHLFTEYIVKASDTIIENVGNNGGTYDDGTDTFITGKNPNNYVWYSGKLWRAVSINNEARTIKLVTQWGEGDINYSNSSSAFEGSYIEDWLNDTTVDGFLGNLRDYEDFIVINAKWDASVNSENLGSITRPNGTTTVNNAVGLLNVYEYQSTNNGETNGYLNNGTYWGTLTPLNNTSSIRVVNGGGKVSSESSTSATLVRPSIVLRSDIKIVSGSGAETDPYRLEGDSDTDLNGVKLNTRYSGEYIKFGDGENNLYRIVSHENEKGTKIVSAKLLKDSGTVKTISFGSSTYLSTSNIINFLNGDFLNSSNGYLTSEQVNMIEDETTWYQGNYNNGYSYKLAKYIDTDMSSLVSETYDFKVGLLRYGELMVMDDNSNVNYWTLTRFNSYSIIVYVSNFGGINSGMTSSSNAFRPSMNLKENVIITSGDGTKENPFNITLAN